MLDYTLFARMFAVPPLPAVLFARMILEYIYLFARMVTPVQRVASEEAFMGPCVHCLMYALPFCLLFCIFLLS